MPTPEQILNLKVCDPACGSGAFLVEACRQLGRQLVEAWRVHGGRPVVPADEDEDLLACRLVAQRCLYGVDRNPMAVDLTKLSLWLATLAKDHPFTFLDHSVRSGDSLVGLTRQQIAYFNWDVAAVLDATAKSELDRDLNNVLRQRQEIFEVPDSLEAPGVKRQKLDAADLALEVWRMRGDMVIDAFFGAEKATARKDLLTTHLKLWQSRRANPATYLDIKRTLDALHGGDHPVTPFHWQIEFPEVFGRGEAGFDAIIGNPPFAGKNNLINGNRTGYLDWLKEAHPESHGNADLVAHFFRRAFALVREGGCFGLIATNTIAQGDTRHTGLRWICTHDGTIYSARKRYKWPGQAAVIVSVVHIAKPPAPSSSLPAPSSQPPAPRSPLPAPRSQPPAPSSSLPAPSSQLPAPRSPLSPACSQLPAPRSPLSPACSPLPAPRSPLFPSCPLLPAPRSPLSPACSLLPAPCFLDGRAVEKITAFLFHAGGHDNPATLNANAGKSFQGSIVLGMGFTFDDTDTKGVANPIALMEGLIDKDERNAERIFPYIGGAEVNDSPTHAHHRYVINFEDMTEAQARQWPDLMAIVEEKVKPERDKLGNNADARRRRERWWLWGRYTPALFAAIRGLDRVLVCCRHQPNWGLGVMPSGSVFAESLVAFALPYPCGPAVLGSNIHEAWARFFGSSMKDDLRYTPTDCFETFPFPPDWETNADLEAAGKAYYEFRADLMVRNDEGLTKTYNRSHDPAETSPDILKLRELHAAMDRAVLDAYGWPDIPTTCDFLLDYEDDEDQDPDTPSRRKKPWRYRWPDDIRDEVLARLLDLNAQRAEQERLTARPAKSAKPTKPKKTKPKPPNDQLMLGL